MKSISFRIRSLRPFPKRMEQFLLLRTMQAYDRVKSVQQTLEFADTIGIGSLGWHFVRHLPEQTGDPENFAVHGAHRRHRIFSAEKTCKARIDLQVVALFMRDELMCQQIVLAGERAH